MAVPREKTVDVPTERRYANKTAAAPKMVATPPATCTLGATLASDGHGSRLVPDRSTGIVAGGNRAGRASLNSSRRERQRMWGRRGCRDGGGQRVRSSRSADWVKSRACYAGRAERFGIVGRRSCATLLVKQEASYVAAPPCRRSSVQGCEWLCHVVFGWKRKSRRAFSAVRAWLTCVHVYSCHKYYDFMWSVACPISYD